MGFMNNLDKQYTDLLQDILENGTRKGDRTGTGTISVFGRQIRHNMKDGFPLLTTKKMPFKTIVTELLWFLRGDTNIKYLVDNGCHIWDGDAYKNWCRQFEVDPNNFDAEELVKGHGDQVWGYPILDHVKPTSKEYKRGQINAYLEGKAEKPFFYLTQEEFINKIKTDDKFAEKWGSLGKIYGYQWRNWGGWKDTKQTGFLHKTDNGWTVKWSDLHSFANGTEWLTTPIQDSDQSLYSDEDEGKKVYYKNITLGYNESFCPVQVTKVIDDKFDKYVGGIDQIQNLINDLKSNPDSRRLMVNAWNVGELDAMVLPPCHYGFQVYTRELSMSEKELWYKNNNINPNEPWYPNVPTRAISLMWNQRSVDTFLGLPFNIASYGLLLEIIAKSVNMVPDQLIGNLGDVHLYSNHIEQAKEQIGREFTEEEILEHLQQSGMDALKDEPRMEYIAKLYKRTRQPFPLPKLNINTEFWPTQGGSCGEGPLDATAIFEGFKNDDFCRCLLEEDIQLSNYQSHSTIKAPLSN